MVTHVTLPQSQAGNFVAKLVTPIVLAAVTLTGTTLGASAETAKRPCGDRTQILERLQQKHEESRQALGLSSDGGVLEILVSPKGGWTILVTYPKRPTCVVAVGEAWQMLQLTVGDPA